MASQVICLTKQTQAINCVLPKNKHLREKQWVSRVKGSMGQCEGQGHDLCSSVPPKLCHQCSAKSTVWVAENLHFASYGSYPNNYILASNGLSCNRPRSKGSTGKLHTKCVMQNAGLRGTADAKVCVGSKKASKFSAEKPPLSAIQWRSLSSEPEISESLVKSSGVNSRHRSRSCILQRIQALPALRDRLLDE